jgi:PilZ domain
MLGCRHDKSLIADEWEAADAHVQLPDALRNEFFNKRGPMPLHHENHRGYHRYFMRAKAVLKRNELRLGCYTKDVSRQGIGLLSPVPLLPLDRVEIHLPNGSVLPLEIARCRRVDRGCFDCGARFAL